MILWRIAADTPTYGADDLTAEGARLTGGRWNRAGTPLLYCSTTRALAALEVLVHLDASDGLPLNRYLVEITLPDDAWEARATLDPAQLVGWDAIPAGLASLDWGTAWAASGASLVAAVPSIVVREEKNALLNPRHPQIRQVRARKARRWDFDPRLGVRR
jgi:RES domain-containing protein